MEPLPEAAARVLRAIIALTESGDRSPTYSEVAAYVDRQLMAVQRQVSNLVAWKYLRRRKGARGFVILRNPDGSTYSPQRTAPKNVSLRAVKHTAPDALTIRIEGEIAAGPAVEPTDGPSLVELPGLAGTPPGHFWLRVKGSSMSGAGILPGSLVYCRRQSDVGPGEVAVCMLDDGTVTLKCVVADRKNGRVKLVPQCDGLEPVTYRSVEIQARVLYVLRQV